MSSITDEITSRLINHSNTFTQDRREPDHALSTPFGPGPQTGSHGDTVVATIIIQNVNVDESGAPGRIVVTLTYAGDYVRQGYFSPGGFGTVFDPNATEKHVVFGKIDITVTQQLFKPPVINVGNIYSIGDVQDINHDSNNCAVAALTPIIQSAFS